MRPANRSELTVRTAIEQQREGMLDTSYHNLGQLYRQLGNRDAAIRTLERALSYGSVMQVWTVRSLAELRIERREYAKAGLLQRALALEPRLEEREALVRLYESMVVDARYRSDPAVWRELIEDNCDCEFVIGFGEP
jgi:Tfp pilus assembly protein PilF